VPNPSTTMQPKDRILDVYGVFVRDGHRWLAIADLIALLAELRVDEQAVRSAASRMKRQELLVSSIRDGVSGYELSRRAAEVLIDGDQRIFRAPSSPESPAWLIAVFSVPESERKRRYLIRSRLQQLGFGQTSAGVMIAPAQLRAEAERMLTRADLHKYVSLWCGDYLGFDDLGTVVATAWDLDAIRNGYETYIATFSEVAGRCHEHGLDDATAFVDRMNNLGTWRTLPYVDPGLPAVALPQDWPGDRARALFDEIDKALSDGAARHFASVVGSEVEPVGEDVARAARRAKRS